MRRPLVTAAILIAFGLRHGLRPRTENAAASGREASQGAPTTGSEQQKGRIRRLGPAAIRPERPVRHQTPRARRDPNAPPPRPEPVFVNGELNVPGAPADSQTVPAKFSQRNDAIDHMPIMAMGCAGADRRAEEGDRRRREAGEPAGAVDSAKPAEELPWTVTVHDLGVSANDPALAGMGYVRAQDRILLVDAPNRIVIGEIKN